MPAKKINTTKKMAATKKNTAALSSAMAAGEGIFGRVEKAMGNGIFNVTIVRGTAKVEVQGIVRGVLPGGQSSVSFIAPPAFVLLSPSTTKLHEIAAVVTRHADMKALKKDGLIDKMLLDERGEDDFFEDREDEGEDVGAEAVAETEVDVTNL